MVFLVLLRVYLGGLRLHQNGFDSDSSGGAAFFVELEPFLRKNVW
jgi:hypothetical protein